MKAAAFAAVAVAFWTAAAVAGEPRNAGGWEPSARADIKKLVMMDRWSARDADFALDTFVRDMGGLVSGQEFLPASHPDVMDMVQVSVTIDPNLHRGCVVGSAALVNPLRGTTSITGLFCSPNGPKSYTYDARYLEVSSSPSRSTAVTRTLDVTDLGKVRPK